jgi:hypothetical protein
MNKQSVILFCSLSSYHRALFPLFSVSFWKIFYVPCHYDFFFVARIGQGGGHPLLDHAVTTFLSMCVPLARHANESLPPLPHHSHDLMTGRHTPDTRSLFVCNSLILFLI